MNKLNFIISLALVSSIAVAEPIELNKPVTCAETNGVLTALRTEYKETPFWGSQLKSSIIVLYVNVSTKTWTLVEFNKNLACILSTGEGYEQTNKQ